MKITQKRLSSVTDGMLVKFNSSNLLEPYDGTGTAQGIASNCRVVAVQPDPDQPPTDVLVCELVIDGACQALLSGSAPSTGGLIYADGSRISVTASGSPIGRLLPRGWSEATGYGDGDLVTIYISGVN